jgi:ribosomal protein S18 acetylase RimI-like enzyme
MSVPLFNPVQILKSDRHELQAAASLMAESDPWKALGFTTEQCLENLERAAIRVDALVVNGELDAFIATVADGIGFEPMIEYLCVKASLRGQGIGTAFVKFFEDLYERADNLYMFVSDINPRAKALYERLGYRQVGEWPDYNLVGQTEYLMRKTRGPKQDRRALAQ